MTGISRKTIPFTTVLVPEPLLTELPNNTQYPLIYNYGRKLLDAEGMSAALLSVLGLTPCSFAPVPVPALHQ